MTKRITLGVENLVRNTKPIAKARIAVLSHHTAVTHELRRGVDTLADVAQVIRIISPENGFWSVGNGTETVDTRTGAEMVSLYPDYPLRKRPLSRTDDGMSAWKAELSLAKRALWPTEEHLNDVDWLVVDLPDVGSRYFTFASSMANCMEVAKQTGTPVIVCDRPNPINGSTIEGNMFDEERWLSFITPVNMPVRHGMTIGELARFIQRYDRRYACDLTVIPLDGWQRRMWWDETDMPWVALTPNMPKLSTLITYPGICLVEATSASEGRGTTLPFEMFGAPGLNPFELAKVLSGLRLPGVAFLPRFFLPTFQKHAGKVCGGVEVHVTNRRKFLPYLTGLQCLRVIRELWCDFRWREEAFEYEAPDDRPALELLVGSARYRQLLVDGGNLDEWVSSWNLDEFEQRRSQALLYT